MDRRSFLKSIPLVVSLPSLVHQNTIHASHLVSDSNELICRGKFDFAISAKLHSRPMNTVIIEIGKSFLGTDYAPDTLETPGEEKLVVNLQTLDCVTFYENSLALARCIKKGKTTFEDYKKELQFIRYRGGIINGYPSRLHYTSDYFFDNERKGVLKNITHELGGVLYSKKINFMSLHAESYRKLRENPRFVSAIQKIEEDINSRQMYHVPKSKVKDVASEILSGDILGITTTKEGLDCKHTGIAIWEEGSVRLMHAPLPGLKVQITKYPLWEYLEHIKDDAGIIVARALEV